MTLLGVWTASQEQFNPKDASFTLQRVMDLGLINHATSADIGTFS